MKNILILLVIAVAAQIVAAQNNIVPIVDMKIGGFLGGWGEGGWAMSGHFARSSKKGDRYRWYRLDGTVETVVSSESGTGEPCDDFTWVRFNGQPEYVDYDKTDGIALGEHATWDAQPRKPRELNRSAAARLYAKTLTAALVKEGIKRPKIGHVRAWRVDLDGDGTDEVLISAWIGPADNPSPRARAGDYSVVMFRSAKGGKVKNSTIVADVVKKSVEFAAPSRFSLSGIADLDGDGTMEVVIHGAYYEGAFSYGYRLDGEKLVEIKELNAGCGV